MNNTFLLDCHKIVILKIDIFHEDFFVIEEDVGSASIEIPVSKESQEITCSAFNDAMDQPIYIYKSLDVLCKYFLTLSLF